MIHINHRKVFAGLLLLTAVSGGIFSCREQRDPIPPPSDELAGRDFFPINIGRYWIYDVEEKQWDQNAPTTTRFQFRERVDTVFQGAEGQLNYRVVRSRRADSTAPWRDDSVLAVVVTPQYVRRTFSNTPSLDLIFPVKDGRYWNPNALAAGDSTIRRYEAVNQPLELPNGGRYEQTVRVTDEGENNLFHLRQLNSAYARRVGRILRERRSYDYCDYNDSLQLGCPNGTGTYIVRGFERLEWLRETGSR